MASETDKFQCVVITPQGTLVNCIAISTQIPAHDGYVGILAHHMPMFCKLGLGLMHITSAESTSIEQVETIILIDGGFAMVSSNVLTVIASQAISPAHTKREKIEQEIEKLRKSAGETSISINRRLHDKQKTTLLEKLLVSPDTSHNKE